MLRICRDRHSVRVSRRRISQVRPLRNSSQTDAQLKRGISAPRTKSPPLAPERGANPLTCRTPTSITGGSVHAPSQTQKPAEGPLLRPSLALNLDPASVHQLTHLLSTSLPQGATLLTHQAPIHPSVTPNTPSPHLQLIQPDRPPTCPSSSQAGLSAPPPVRVSSPLYLFQSSQPHRLDQTQA